MSRFAYKWQCAFVLLAVLVYVLLATGLYSSAGRTVAAFSILPVTIIGLYTNAKTGFVTGLLFLLFNWLLFKVLGSTESLLVFIQSGAIAGSTAVALVGACVGYFSMLNRRLGNELEERKQIQQELNKLNRRLAIQTQQARQARAQFLAAMSHKLRTPMNVSMGLSTLLLETTSDVVQSDYAHDILHNNRELVGIVDSILEYTKVESGDIELNLEEFQLDRLIEQIKHSVNGKAIERNVTVRTVIDPQTPLCLIGDEKRLQLIIGNLLNNALDATQDGDEITISIKPELIDEHRNHTSLNIKIIDTGKGIPSDMLATLFEPFSSAYASTTEAGNRAGIGTALCKSLCKEMGGSIQAESEVGKGTIITVMLPFNTSKSIAVSRLAPPTTTITDSAGHRRYSPNLSTAPTDLQNSIKILLAEDNILNAKVRIKNVRNARSSSGLG